QDLASLVLVAAGESLPSRRACRRRRSARPKRKARRLKLGSAGLFRRIAGNAPQFPAQIWLMSTLQLLAFCLLAFSIAIGALRRDANLTSNFNGAIIRA